MCTKSSNWFAAMLRKSLRSIFPLRVFGSAGAQWITSGIAKNPICSKNQKKQPQGRVNHYIWIFRTVTITLQISCRSMENKSAQHFEDAHSHH